MIEVEIEKSVYLECYHDILDCDDDVILLWGGRYGGKSKYTAQRLIEKCLSATYFKCILVKKTYETIKESQYDELKKVIAEWELEELFEFRLSPLEIICANGNRFIARGCDKPEKMKSIKDPTDAWYEEGNQLTEDDYIITSTTLRSNKVKVQEWLSFNPEHNESSLETFWIYKTFFKGVGHSNKSFSHIKTIEFKSGDEVKTAQITYTSKHTTYRDNPYVPDHIKAKLENLRVANRYYYDVYALGLWGEREILSPFAPSYNKDKHESNEAKYNPDMRVIFIFDFNLTPFAVNMAHMWRDEYGEHIHIFDELSMESGSIPRTCEIIRTKYLRSLPGCQVTGDATSQKGDISQVDNASHYMQIQRLLKLKTHQFKLPKANPTHQNSKQDVNYLLEHFPDFKINPVMCPNTCRDLKIVQVDAYDSIIKRNRSDISQLSDHLDNVRYLVNTFCKAWILNHQKRS